MALIEYTADTSGYYITTEGAWSTGTGTYYYHIFELEVGKLYVIKLPVNASNPLTRWRNAQADTNVIGSANLTWAGGSETPVNGGVIVFTATQPYLISYGGSAGGSVEVISENPTQSFWMWNETIPSATEVEDSRTTIPIISNGKTYNRIDIGRSRNVQSITLRNSNSDPDISVYLSSWSNPWPEPSYRIMTFGTEPEGELLSYLQRFAVLYVPPTPPSTKLTFDLSDYAGWQALTPGQTYAITLVAHDNDGTYADSDPSVAVNVTKSGGAMPSKGDIIEIESKRYRVLDVNGTTAKVFGLFDAGTTSFGSNNTYEGSTLDTFLNDTWLNQQSAIFQSAVVPTSIISHTYQYSDSEPASWTYKYDYNWTPSDPEHATRTASATAITRNVFALDMEDYFTYHESNATTSNDLMMFFFEGDGSKGSYSNNFCWLRSAYAGGPGRAWYVYGYGGNLLNLRVVSEDAVRPALNIDLSKIEWRAAV